MRPEDLRKEFPHARHTIYLNHAATSPLSTPVVEAIQAYLKQRHETQIENYFSFQHTVDETRSALAGLLGVSSDRIDFAPNTSSALNIVANGIAWKPGDRILIPACEFPANVYPFLNLKRRGVVVDFLDHDEGTFSLDRLDQALQTPTRLLALSWVQFLSGFKADLLEIGALCRRRGVLFCVDGIQGLGALKLPAGLDECGIDFFAAGAHKWLMGTQGLAVFYCSRDLQESLIPSHVGWLHGPVDWESFFDYKLEFHDDVRRFRTGTMNHIGIAALHAALQLYLTAGPAWCEQRIRTLTTRMETGLAAIGLRKYGCAGEKGQSGIVTCYHENPNDVFHRLEQEHIHISVRNKKLRFAPTWYNTENEVDQALDVLEAADRK